MSRRPSACAAVLSASVLSASVLSGCGAPASGPSSAAPTVPANVSCSGPSVGGTERGVDIGGKRGIKGQKGASTDSTGIVAHGTCKIVGVPDAASLAVTIRVQAPTVRLAVDGVNGKAGVAITILKSKGVAPSDIGGNTMKVVPVGSRLLRSATGIGGVQITGYAATETITASLHDLATAGPTISQVTDSTGDSGKISVNYFVADDRALRDEARTAAIAQAQANARQLAGDSGVALGQLASLAEMGDEADPAQAGMYQESVDMVFALDS